MSYVLGHTTLGFCLWDLPALIVLIVTIVFFAWKHREVKKQEEELEEELSALYADDTTQANQEV